MSLGAAVAAGGEDEDEAPAAVRANVTFYRMYCDDVVSLGLQRDLSVIIVGEKTTFSHPKKLCGKRSEEDLQASKETNKITKASTARNMREPRRLHRNASGQ